MITQRILAIDIGIINLGYVLAEIGTDVQVVECDKIDITKIKQKLGWSPTVNLKEGVQIMLEHINDWHDAPLWDVSGIEKATEPWFRYLDKDPEMMLND